MLMFSSASFDIRDRTPHYHILSLWVADFGTDVALGYLIVLHISGVYIQQYTIAPTSTDSNRIDDDNLYRWLSTMKGKMLF